VLVVQVELHLVAAVLMAVTQYFLQSLPQVVEVAVYMATLMVLLVHLVVQVVVVVPLLQVQAEQVVLELLTKVMQVVLVYQQ
jgi:hypothetical protein